MDRGSVTTRLVRLIRLLNLLSTRNFMWADDLCLKLQVSKRTIYRDLAILQKAGINLRCDPVLGYVLEDGGQLVHEKLSHVQVPAKHQHEFAHSAE